MDTYESLRQATEVYTEALEQVRCCHLNLSRCKLWLEAVSKVSRSGPVKMAPAECRLVIRQTRLKAEEAHVLCVKCTVLLTDEHHGGSGAARDIKRLCNQRCERVSCRQGEFTNVVQL